MSEVRVRFAPSPTGTLHIGGARSALFNAVFAKNCSGKFILRIDDTDKERSKPEYEEDIKSSLRWLGVSWDEGPDVGGEFGPYRQSEKLERHIEIGKKLLAEDKAYMGDGGEVRLRYPSDKIVVKDLVCGDCEFQVDALGPEPVILRSDGTPTYHLASVVDDIDMKITHIIRGQDHLTNTAKHQVIFAALGADIPKFAHLPLILSEDRSKMSKRKSDDIVAVTEFRTAGYLPEAIVNFLMLLGWSHPEAKEQLSLDEAVKSFSLDRVGKTGAIFEKTKLNFLNAWWIRQLSAERLVEEVEPYSKDYTDAITAFGEASWLEALSSLKSDLNLLSDVKKICELLFAYEVKPTEETSQYLEQNENKGDFLKVVSEWSKMLAEVDLELDANTYSKEHFAKIRNTIKKNVELNNKKLLFQSLRVAITGELSGPELNVLVPLVTRDRLQSRAESVLGEFS